jgi:hypothetical protein
MTILHKHAFALDEDILAVSVEIHHTFRHDGIAFDVERTSRWF